MTLKTSLLITGDSSVARAEVQALTKAVETAAASTRAAVAPAQQLDAAQKQTAASAREQSAAIAIADTTLADAAKSARQLSTVNGALVASTGAASRGVGQMTKAVNDNADAARRQQFAIRNAGQQVGDFGLSIAAGISPAQAFAQQAGQMGYALSEMGGKLGKVGAFLTGPWGIALTIGAAVVAPLIGKLFETAEAAKAVEVGSSGLADAQAALGQMFDLTTGKLKKQNSELAAANELLRLNIRLTAINLRADSAKEAASSAKVFGAAGSISVSDRIRGAFTDPRLFGTVRGAIDGTERGRTNASNLQTVVRDLQAGRTTNEQVLRASEKLDFTGLKISKEEFQAAIRDGVSSVAKRQIAALADKSLDDKSLDPALRNDPKTKKPPKAKSTAARDEFGRDAGDKLAGLVSEFDGTPALVDKTNAKVRELNDLIDDLGRKKPPGFKELIAQAEAAKIVVRDGLIREVAKGFEQPKTLAEKAAFAVGQLDAAIGDLRKNQPPGFEKLIADAETAKGVIRDGLQKPYADFIQAQQEGLDVQRLTLAGRVDEAEALRTVQGLQRTMGPLTEAQKEAVLATTAAMRAQGAAIEDLRARNAKYVEAIGGVKAVVEDATQAFVRGDLGQLLKSPGKLLDIFQTFEGRKLFDKMFKETFDDLEDQANGTSIVKDASDRMASAVDKAAASIATLGNAAGAAAGNVAGGGTAIAQAAQAGVPTSPTALNALLAGYKGAIGKGPDGGFAAAVGGAPPVQGDIVVTGQRNPIVSAITSVGTAVTGLFTDPTKAKALGSSIGNYAGKGLEGAATGTFVAGVTKALGIKTSTTGAQIGGAIGSFVPIPGGQIIGSIAGAVLGGLFKTTKTGSATIGNMNGEAGVTGTSGNSAAYKKAAGGLAGTITDTLTTIVSRLGGELGNFAVSIGQKGDKYVVDTSGRGSTKTGKKNDGITGYKTAEEAQAAALADAIADGAIQGLSPKVAAAFRSSTDIDKALTEALKVQDLELTLGGLSGTVNKAFRDFEATAKERVRLATKYGFDLVAIEKRNGEDRAKLAKQLAQQEVGSLQKLIDEMTSGSLFEGSALDKIGVLNDAIAKAKADLDAGVDGAADVLTDLYQKRLSASKDAYGTTSGYAADRASTLDQARAAVAATNARIVAAQAATKTSDPALTTTNATLDEIADQNARLVAAGDETNELLARIASGGGIVSGRDLTELAAY